MDKEEKRNNMKVIAVIAIIIVCFIMAVAAFYWPTISNANDSVSEAVEVIEQNNNAPTIKVLNDDGTITSMTFIPEISELSKIDGKNISTKDFITIRNTLAPASGVCIALKAKDSFYYEINGVLVNGYFNDCYITREQLMSDDISFVTNADGSLKYYSKQTRLDDQRSYYTIEALKDKNGTIVGLAATYYNTETKKTQYDVSLDYFVEGEYYNAAVIRGIVTAADLSETSLLFNTKEMDEGIYWNYGAASENSKVIDRTKDARSAELYQVWLPDVKTGDKLIGEVKVFMGTPAELINSNNAYGLAAANYDYSSFNFMLKKMYSPSNGKLTALVFTQE